MQFDYGKVFIAFSAVMAGITLIITGDHAQGTNIIVLVLGYTMGNGRLIAKGENPQPMMSRKGTSTGKPEDSVTGTPVGHRPTPEL